MATTKNVGDLVQADINKTVTYDGPNPGDHNSGQLTQILHAADRTVIQLSGGSLITALINNSTETIEIDD
jgi:hypothetical protein